jgi:hypothetical protein
LSTGDEFGLGLASIGDFDGDGNTDLAVGARRDDDGPFLDSGAVWLLFLGTCDLVAVPPLIDFGSVMTGGAADAQFFIRNEGLTSASGSISESCASFSIVAGGGPFTLLPEDSLLVTVRFSPTYTATFHCTVSTGASCGQVALTGKGVAPPPQPAITSILDIPGDEGGRVRVTFTRSTHDQPNAYPSIGQYEIYRRISGSPAVVGEIAAAPDRDRQPLLEDWDFVTSAPAHGEAVYNVVVGTLADSTVTNGMHWSVFMVRATTNSAYQFYDSAPDSGYSLDNTPPPAPTTFSVAYGDPDGTVLTWARSNARDLLGYKVFRTTAGIAPTDRDLVTVTRNTEWTDIVKDVNVRYQIASVDSAGNESDRIGPDKESGNGAALPTRLALHQNTPNPFNPTTAIRYDVPAPGGRVTLSVYDVHGRLVHSLVDQAEPAGTRAVNWDGRNNAGTRVASGTYFCRIESAGTVLTRKMTLLE